MPLGDSLELLLTSLGITKDKVENWLGRPCGCQERQEKLNRLGYWMRRILLGKTENAREHLDNLMKD